MPRHTIKTKEMKHFSANLITLLFSTSAVFSQTISGTVVDLSSKQALAYVNIGIIGKGIGTVSDINGKFSINLDDSLNSQTLKFSYIGYTSKILMLEKLKRT